MLRALFRRYGKKVSCSVCGTQIVLNRLVNHFQLLHSEFDYESTCILCLKKISDYEAHVKLCAERATGRIRKEQFSPVVHCLCSRQIRTEAMRRWREYAPPTTTSRFAEFDLACLVKADKFRKTENIVYPTGITYLSNEYTKECYQSSSLPAEQRSIWVSQQADETLKLAIQAVLAYEPNVWYHLTISVMHVAQFIDLCRTYDDFFAIDFWCWCDSKNIFKKDQLPECEILHVHLVSCIVDLKTWKKNVWDRLKSPDGKRYKKYHPIGSVQHFTNALLYLSQERWCNDVAHDNTKHFEIHRPIHPKLEPFIMLVQPTVILHEVHRYMYFRARMSRFSIHRYQNSRRYIYYTLMTEVMERIQHYTVPLCKGELQKVFAITPQDKTLARTADGGFLNLIPGNKDITLASIMSHSDMKLVWSKRKHGQADDAFSYCNTVNGTLIGNFHGGNVNNYYSSDNNSSSCAFDNLNVKEGEIHLSLDVETTGLSKERDEIIQIALYGDDNFVMNHYMMPAAVPILPEATRVNRMQVVNGKLQREGRNLVTLDRETVRSSLVATLQGLMQQGLKITLLAKNGNCLDFPMLKAFLGNLDGITTVDTEHLLRRKFEKSNPKSFTLEDYAAAVKYHHYSRPLHDAFNDAKLHYELLCLKL